jgi:ABC-type transport system involved in cytochrome c biogenesis permease subunit
MMKAATFLLVLAALAAAVPATAADDLAAWREIAVQDGGRYKPLDTFAREAARGLVGPRPFGAESIKGLPPAEWLLAMMADPERWKDEPIVRVTHAGLRAAVGLEPGRDRYSFRELSTHEPFLTAAARIHERLRQDGEARLDPLEQEIVTTYDHLAQMAGVLSGAALRVVPASVSHPPHPGHERHQAQDEWSAIAELEGRAGPAARLRGQLDAVVAAYARGDRAAAGAAAAELRDGLRALDPPRYPEAATLRREVRYNTLKPFRTSWLLYLGALLLLMASFPLASRAATALGALLLLAGFALQTYGLALRVLISGRAPVTNMYETVVFVAWGAVLFALLFELRYRVRTFAAMAAGLGTLALVLADSVPILDGSIEPLVPVLRDNTWLTLHVLTIMLGYAALFLATGLAHLALGFFFFRPGSAATLKTLSQFLHRCIQAGTLFLAVGILLGGVWASYSWGRFWGWDPKETWSLIALLGYLALLHGRFAGWVRDFGLAAGSIVGFLLVLMAWYGVNYILGTGLHSYGFGSGGLGWAAAFVALEAGVLIFSFARRSHLRKPAAAPAAAPAHP